MPLDTRVVMATAAAEKSEDRIAIFLRPQDAPYIHSAGSLVRAQAMMKTTSCSSRPTGRSLTRRTSGNLVPLRQRNVLSV